MKWLRELFVIAFARYRRRRPDASPAWCWRAADRQIWAWLVLPSTLAFAGLLIAFETWNGTWLGKFSNSSRIVGILFGMALGIFARRSYADLRTNIPPLPIMESVEDARALTAFRALLGAVALISLAALGIAGALVRSGAH